MAKIEIPLKKDYAGAFKYWVDTNTENGVCTIPEYICKGIVGMLGKQPVATDTNVGDTISRQAAITALSHMCSEDEKGITVSRANVDSMLRYLASVQPEEAIPVSWIEARIERFKAEDNAFGGLTANIMLVMLNEWKREQEGEMT